MEVIGQTIDDAAGEAFDKCAKVMGLGYPGGPIVNRLANEGNPDRFKFAKPHIDGLNYSFSGLKTSFLYTLRDAIKENPDFIEENQSFTFNKWSKSHCRQIGHNGLCVKISVKCLLGEGKFDKINLHKVIVISLSKFSY